MESDSRILALFLSLSIYNASKSLEAYDVDFTGQVSSGDPSHMNNISWRVLGRIFSWKYFFESTLWNFYLRKTYNWACWDLLVP